MIFSYCIVLRLINGRFDWSSLNLKFNSSYGVCSFYKHASVLAFHLLNIMDLSSLKMVQTSKGCIFNNQ